MRMDTCEMHMHGVHVRAPGEHLGRSVSGEKVLRLLSARRVAVAEDAPKDGDAAAATRRQPSSSLRCNATERDDVQVVVQ